VPGSCLRREAETSTSRVGTFTVAPRFISVQAGAAAMLVERNVYVLNVEIVGEAYDIAANYLKKTGAMAESGVNERLLEIIYKMFNAGDRNRLRLANLAISKFQRIK
jgi:hypothetical protein